MSPERIPCLPGFEALLHSATESTQRLFIKLKEAANGSIRDDEVSIDAGETAEQRELRQRKIKEMCRWSKMEFGATIDKFGDDSDKLISRLPASLRDPATQCVASVMRVITSFFGSALSTIIHALKVVYQTCKETLETIAAYTSDAIREIYIIFQYRQENKPIPA